jgi:hypothetical protein
MIVKNYQELDLTSDLDEIAIKQNKSMIGAFKLVSQLGRFDIQDGVATIRSYSFSPFGGHHDWLNLCADIATVKLMVPYDSYLEI